VEDQKYYKRLPGGKIEDTRYKYGRGTRVKVVSGPYVGMLAEVSSCVFIQDQSHPDANNPGYHITLEDGRWTTVKWDTIEAV